MRQNHLIIDGWIVLRFSYDDILEKPRVGQQLIQQLMGKLGISSYHNELHLCPAEHVIIRPAASLSTPLTPKFAASKLGLHRDTVVKHIGSFIGKELLIPTRTDVKRICSYRVNKALLHKVT